MWWCVLIFNADVLGGKPVTTEKDPNFFCLLRPCQLIGNKTREHKNSIRQDDNEVCEKL